jgi:putative restriction endonuclease
MDTEDPAQLFARITIWKRRDERAPHKPLLVLLALAHCLRGDKRMIPFEQLDKELRPLLAEFGPPRSTTHTEYPFWRLQNDHVWEVIAAGPLVRRQGQTDPKRSELLKHHATGGLPAILYDRLRRDSRLVDEVSSALLQAHFPESLHNEIRTAVGLPSAGDRHFVTPRDPEFRAAVIRAYRHRCVICGYALRLENSDVGIEAAHIKWHQAKGPDVIANGLCLCVLHHRLFDRGALGLTEDVSPKLIVSEHLHGGVGLAESVLKFAGRDIAKPLRDEYRPKAEFIRWHRSQVFRGPNLAFQSAT